MSEENQEASSNTIEERRRAPNPLIAISIGIIIIIIFVVAIFIAVSPALAP